ncbi:hypothetical protein ACT41Q_14310 [Acinetobacter baumannii]
MKNIFKLVLSAALLPLMVACQAQTVDLTFLVYNYSTEGLGEIQVNGKGSTIADAV